MLAGMSDTRASAWMAAGTASCRPRVEHAESTSRRARSALEIDSDCLASITLRIGALANGGAPFANRANAFFERFGELPEASQSWVGIGPRTFRRGARVRPRPAAPPDHPASPR